MFKDTHAFSGFSVNNFDEARVFYEQVLGLRVGMQPMGLLLHIAGGNDIFVYQKDDHKPAEFTVLNFSVEDIDAAIDDLKKQSVVFEHYDNLPAPLDEKGVLRGLAAGVGPDIAWFKDPAGNVLAVLQQE